MTKVLVPLDGNGECWTQAAYFALEFAKRTGAKVLLLTFTPERGAPSGLRRRRIAPDDQNEELDRLIAGSLAAGLQIESYVTNGDFVARVAEFARHHNVSRVVLALPEGKGAESALAARRVRALQDQLSCVLVTVRSRQDHRGAAAVSP